MVSVGLRILWWTYKMVATTIRLTELLAKTIPFSYLNDIHSSLVYIKSVYQKTFYLIFIYYFWFFNPSNELVTMNQHANSLFVLTYRVALDQIVHFLHWMMWQTRQEGSLIRWHLSQTRSGSCNMCRHWNMTPVYSTLYTKFYIMLQYIKNKLIWQFSFNGHRCICLSIQYWLY